MSTIVRITSPNVVTCSTRCADIDRLLHHLRLTIEDEVEQHSSSIVTGVGNALSDARRALQTAITEAHRRHDQNDKGYSNLRQFTARFPKVKDAVEFMDNVDRVCATAEPGCAIREGRAVTFSAYTTDPHGYSIYGDIELSAGHYGSGTTYLNGNRCPREY